MTWNIYPQFTLECIRIVVKVNAWDVSKHTSDFLDTVPNLQQFSTQKAGFLKIHSFLNMVTENLWLWFFEVLSPRVLKYAFGAKSEKSWKSTWDISWRFLKKLVLILSRDFRLRGRWERIKLNSFWLSPVFFHTLFLDAW